MTLYYERSGHGPDVVLVHGWGLHGGVWADVARGLSKEFRVTVPDLPGHGRSRDFRPHEFTPEVLAEEVRRVLPGPAVWTGWSLGAFVALGAAQQSPRAVEKLVLVGATPKYVQSADWPHAMSLAVLQQFARSLEQDYVATLTRFLSLQTGGEDREVLRRLREEMFRHGQPPVAALRDGLRLLETEDRRAALPAITAPALVVHGERDRFAPVAAARFLAGHLAHARLEIVRGAGHAPFLSHPALFLEQMRGFLGG
jgi:pimeloyl-[acyl-carrier protein] methyl ester esterase